MNIQLPLNNGDAFTLAPWFGATLVYQLVLAVFLFRILTRADFDALNKILWVIVVVLVPFLGFLLYLVAAPAPQPQSVNSPRRSLPRSDVSGTPWEADPGHDRPL